MCTLSSEDELCNLLPVQSPTVCLCEAGHAFILSPILPLSVTQTQANIYLFIYLYFTQRCFKEWFDNFGFSGRLLNFFFNVWLTWTPTCTLGDSTSYQPISPQSWYKLYWTSCSEGTAMYVVQTQLIWWSHMRVWIQNLVTWRRATKSPSTEGGRHLHPSPQQVDDLERSKQMSLDNCNILK